VGAVRSNRRASFWSQDKYACEIQPGFMRVAFHEVAFVDSGSHLCLVDPGRGHSQVGSLAKFNKMKELQLHEIIAELMHLIHDEIYLHHNQDYFRVKLHWPEFNWKYIDHSVSAN